ncbi:WBC30 protein, partial [Geococcyx californianus]|nr:WBC30 protein [Geococcyx californianus]
PSDGINGYRCPSGFYCPAGTGLELPCEPGTFSPVPGASGTSPQSCVPCYPGSFCASIGLSSPTGPCTEGFYCPANFSSVSPTAFLCPQGHFCQSGAAHPTPCPAGEYQPARGSASCVPCQRGFYCQELVTGDARRCPPHTYCPAGTLKLACPG